MTVSLSHVWQLRIGVVCAWESIRFLLMALVHHMKKDGFISSGFNRLLSQIDIIGTFDIITQYRSETKKNVFFSWDKVSKWIIERHKLHRIRDKVGGVKHRHYWYLNICALARNGLQSEHIRILNVYVLRPYSHVEATYNCYSLFPKPSCGEKFHIATYHYLVACMMEEAGA